jgi:hypothetical protein
MENEQARNVIMYKIPGDHFVLRADRQAVTAALVEAIIKHLGTR